MTGPRGRVLITDHPWSDVAVEAGILAAAGWELVDASPGGGPVGPGEQRLAELAEGVVGIITNWARVSADLMAAAGPTLAVVGRLGVGIDNIDVAAAAERGVVVIRVPDYCVAEVSDHVAALVLAWARGITYFDRDVRRGRFEPGSHDLRRVRDLVVGVWGAGSLGLATADVLAALGCEVLLDDRHAERHAERNSPYAAVPVDELLSRSDVVTLHLPLNDSTRGIVDAAALSRMQPGSLLVNTARGRLVVIEDLVAALEAGRPGAAALDVFPDEPYVPTQLLDRDDVILTPHVGFASTASIDEVRRRATADVVRVLDGEAPHDPWPPRS